MTDPTQIWKALARARDNDFDLPALARALHGFRGRYRHENDHGDQEINLIAGSVGTEHGDTHALTWHPDNGAQEIAFVLTCAEMLRDLVLGALPEDESRDLRERMGAPSPEKGPVYGTAALVQHARQLLAIDYPRNPLAILHDLRGLFGVPGLPAAQPLMFAITSPTVPAASAILSSRPVGSVVLVQQVNDRAERPPALRSLIEGITARVGMAGESIVMTMRVPRDHDGTWWIDIETGDGVRVAVTWRPGPERSSIYGVYVAADGYGEKPDHVVDTNTEAADLVVAGIKLLRDQRTTHDAEPEVPLPFTAKDMAPAVVERGVPVRRRGNPPPIAEVKAAAPEWFRKLYEKHVDDSAHQDVDHVLLWAHVVAMHCNAGLRSPIDMTYTELVEHHNDEHNGPGGIRNHPDDARNFTMPRVLHVLGEVEPDSAAHYDATIKKLGGILDAIAIVVRGEPAKGEIYGWHDLAERVKKQLDQARSESAIAVNKAMRLEDIEASRDSLKRYAGARDVELAEQRAAMFKVAQRVSALEMAIVQHGEAAAGSEEEWAATVNLREVVGEAAWDEHLANRENWPPLPDPDEPASTEQAPDTTAGEVAGLRAMQATLAEAVSAKPAPVSEKLAELRRRLAEPGAAARVYHRLLSPQADRAWELDEAASELREKADRAEAKAAAAWQRLKDTDPTTSKLPEPHQVGVDLDTSPPGHPVGVGQSCDAPHCRVCPPDRKTFQARQAELEAETRRHQQRYQPRPMPERTREMPWGAAATSLDERLAALEARVAKLEGDERDADLEHRDDRARAEAQS